MNRILLVTALLAANIVQAAENFRPNLQPPPSLEPLPGTWTLQGGGGPHALPGSCDVGVDTRLSGDELKLFTVRCTSQDIPSFGGAQMVVDANDYRGKRVRVSGWLKVSSVEDVANPRFPSVVGGAGLWLGVGSEAGGLRRDRMADRLIKGTTEWVYRDFVADVPSDSKRLIVGFWMEGKGQVWVRDLKVEKVSKKVPVNFLQVDESALGITLKK